MQFCSGSSALNGGSSRDSSGSPRISVIQNNPQAEAQKEFTSCELREQYSALHEKLDALLADRKTAQPRAERLAIRNVGRIHFINIADLEWIEAADNYVKLHTGDAVHVMRDTMQGLERRLPTGRFVQVNRSSIVNLRRVRALEPLTHGEYTVILESGKRLTLTRAYRETLREICTL